MSSRSSSFRFESPSSRVHRLPQFKTFEQCNLYLIAAEEIDLVHYIRVTRNVSFDHELVSHIELINSQSYWINNILRFLVNISHHEPNRFLIPLQSIEDLGFDVLGQKSKTPKWVQRITNREDNNLKMEKRFLKKHKLIEHIDYIEVIGEVDREAISIGHNISRIAFYRLLSKEYGVRFLEAMLARMTQVCYYFNEYKKQYQNETMASMKRTIAGLNDDVRQLAEATQRNEPLRTEFDLVSRYEDSYAYSCPLTPVSSEVIMSTCEYPDELTAIHDIIESSINQVDGKIMDINSRLIDITTKIDDLVDTITLSTDGSMRTTCSRCSTHANTIMGIEPERNSNPIIDHVNSIFHQYEQINNGSRRHRNTCIGYEQQL